jgi:dATP pyrophosphohydrolase
MPDVSRATVRVVDVYPYRQSRGATEFLLLRRAGGVPYAGQWRMVGGKIEPGEAVWQAALRELREETGRDPVRAWTVPSVNAFYEWQTDRLNLIPAFAAELDGSPDSGGADPVLDDEHDAFVWLSAEAAAARLRWPEQRRLLHLIDALLLDDLPPELTLPVVRDEDAKKR